jgi:hypothetical protein
MQEIKTFLLCPSPKGWQKSIRLNCILLPQYPLKPLQLREKSLNNGYPNLFGKVQFIQEF